MPLRICRAAILSAIVGLLCASSAAAHRPLGDRANGTKIVSDSSRDYQKWIGEAKVPTPDLTLFVYDEPCPGAPHVTGCTFQWDREIYFKPPKLRGKAPSRLRVFLWHEVAHMVDYYLMDDALREQFTAILGLEGREWDRHRTKPARGTPAGENPGPPMEKFAQGYAECALKGPTITKRPERAIRYRYRPTPAQHAAVCRFIEEIPGL